MQYQVPQFIDMESRIIGPLTLKQFLYLAFAGAILFVLWFLLIPAVWIFVAIPIIAAAATFAFLKINDRPFVYFFLSLLKYFSKPKLYIFTVPVPTAPVPDVASAFGAKGRQDKRDEVQQNATPAPGSSEPGRLTPLKLKELALILDTGSELTDEQQ